MVVVDGAEQPAATGSRLSSRARTGSFSPSLSSSSTSRPAEPGGQRAWVGAGVVHTVGEQHDAGVAGRHPGPARGPRPREGRPHWSVRARATGAAGRPGRADGTGWPRCNSTVASDQNASTARSVAGQLGGQRADRRGRGAHPLATHRAGHVDGQDHRAAGVRTRSRTMMSVSSGTGRSASTTIVSIQVDLVGATPVGQAGQVARAAGRAVTSCRGRRTASRAAICRARGPAPPGPRRPSRGHQGYDRTALVGDAGCAATGGAGRGGVPAPPDGRVGVQHHATPGTARRLVQRGLRVQLSWASASVAPRAGPLGPPGAGPSSRRGLLFNQAPP